VMVVVVTVVAAVLAEGGLGEALGVVGLVGLVLILGDQVVLADRLLGIDVAAAVEVGGLVGAAGAVVDGGLRPAAERTRAAAARGKDGVGCIALLHPIAHGVEHCLRLRTDAAAAMGDTGRQEEAEPAAQLVEAAVVVGDLAVVVARLLPVDELIGA